MGRGSQDRWGGLVDGLLGALPTLGWFWLQNHRAAAQLEDFRRTFDATFSVLKSQILGKYLYSLMERSLR